MGALRITCPEINPCAVAIHQAMSVFYHGQLLDK